MHVFEIMALKDGLQQQTDIIFGSDSLEDAIVQYDFLTVTLKPHHDNAIRLYGKTQQPGLTGAFFQER
jgi:hypothetical protein